MSYDTGVEFGYDQIHVDTHDLREFLGPFDVNRHGDVNALNHRENRLLKKIQQYTPSCERKQQMANEPVNFFNRDGMYQSRTRKEFRDNIEDKYLGDRQIPQKPDCKWENPKKEAMGGDVAKAEQLQAMQKELLELQRKNDMLVLFIFFLAVVVLVQYSRLHNSPQGMQLLMVPTQQPQQSPIVESA